MQQAKDHCRVDIDADDALISESIAAATDYAEQTTGRPFITRTVTFYTDNFADLELSTDVQSVTAIRYYDKNGALQTLDAGVYQTDLRGLIGRIRLAPNQSWPEVEAGRIDAVEIDAVIGIGDNAEDIPQSLITAILMLVGHWYNNRESSIVVVSINSVPLSTAAILMRHRAIMA